jgi:hypothetical protein
MTKLSTLTLAAAFAAAVLAPGMAAACMKNSVSAQGPLGTPTTMVDGSGTTTTPFTPLPETKTGG